MTNLLKALILFFIPSCLLSQNEVQFSHFIQAGTFVNPALCGAKDGLNISLISRNQWVGFDNPPSTQLLNIEKQFEFLSSGMGLSLLNDRLGNESQTWFKFNYSYHLKPTHFLNINGGVTFGLISLEYNAATLIYENFDPAGIYTSFSTFLPHIGSGVAVFYKSVNAGFSFSKTFDNSKDEWNMNLPHNYFAFFDYHLKVLPNLGFIPSIYWQKTPYITSYIFGIQTIALNKIYAGLFYRKQESYNIQLGYSITQNVNIGYGYDLSFGELTLYHSGSHEIYIGININPNAKEYFYHKSPRFF